MLEDRPSFEKYLYAVICAALFVIVIGGVSSTLYNRLSGAKEEYSIYVPSSQYIDTSQTRSVIETEPYAAYTLPTTVATTTMLVPLTSAQKKIVPTVTTVPYVPPQTAPTVQGTSIQADNCAIKGNISTHNGDRIYHVPGSTYYNDTIIDPSKGERYFCSVAEAVAAGWRAPKN